MRRYQITRLFSQMTRKKSTTPPEHHLLLPNPPSNAPIVDTHTHLVSTFESYRQRYKGGKHETIFDLLRTLYANRNVEAIVDVWCEAPVRKLWKEIADSAIQPADRQDKWAGLDYWFVMGKCQRISFSNSKSLNN